VLLTLEGGFFERGLKSNLIYFVVVPHGGTSALSRSHQQEALHYHRYDKVLKQPQNTS